MDLRLRRAVLEDVDLLFYWANDKEVRANAFHTAPIPYEDHVIWFDRMMSDAQAVQYIVCEDTMPVGQIRLNFTGNTAQIDYSIRAESRGLGYGSSTLRLVELAVAERITQILYLEGRVKYGNTASARAFENCGYTRTEHKTYIQYTKQVQTCDFY